MPLDGRKLIVAPAILKLTRGESKRTLTFFRRLARTVLEERGTAALDLSHVEEVSAGAATVLAAEVARCLEMSPNSVVGVGVPPKSLAAARMLDRYQIASALGMPSVLTQDIESILRLRHGYADEIRRTEFLDRFLTPLFPEDSPLKGRIKGALTEALLNIVDHAYPKDWIAPKGVKPGRWWISGLRAGIDRKLWVCVYDQGIGLPSTLPRSRSDAIRAAVSRVIGTGEHVDHRLIKTAVQTSMSQTGLQGRGRGLREMAKLIDRAGDGALWIMSEEGTYVYGKGTFSQDSGWTNPVRLSGTLIVWALTITDAATAKGESTQSG